MRPSRGTVLRFANEGGLPERADWCGFLGISPLAIQMAVALAVSFVIGYVYFAERWAWIVLTAFIVGSGNRGRLDVAYKSVVDALCHTCAYPASGLLGFFGAAHPVATSGRNSDQGNHRRRLYLVSAPRAVNRRAAPQRPITRVRVPFVPRLAVVTNQPCRISHMRDRDVPPILGFPGTFQDPINQ